MQQVEQSLDPPLFGEQPPWLSLHEHVELPPPEGIPEQAGVSVLAVLPPFVVVAKTTF
ncbi:MAG: hypothetical protein ACLP59_15610 [Bryobacteraceae bacterium]